MHIWGDKDFDWDALNDACYYIEKNCRRWGRMGVHTKEKYGTLRLSTTVAYWTYWPVHGIVYPGYCYYRWPKWLIRYVEYPLTRMFMYLGITRMVNTYQTAVLKFFWRRAARKWSHISEEILDEYNWTFDEEPK